MSSHVQSPVAPPYSRAYTMVALGIRSRSTLTDYCNLIGIPPGVHDFTQEEFDQLKELRAWCKRGRRKGDYHNHRGKPAVA